jgi:hypothetical protein
VNGKRDNAFTITDRLLLEVVHSADCCFSSSRVN